MIESTEQSPSSWPGGEHIFASNICVKAARVHARDVLCGVTQWAVLSRARASYVCVFVVDWTGWRSKPYALSTRFESTYKHTHTQTRRVRSLNARSTIVSVCVCVLMCLPRMCTYVLHRDVRVGALARPFSSRRTYLTFCSRVFFMIHKVYCLRAWLVWVYVCMYVYPSGWVVYWNASVSTRTKHVALRRAYCSTFGVCGWFCRRSSLKRLSANATFERILLRFIRYCDGTGVLVFFGSVLLLS